MIAPLPTSPAAAPSKDADGVPLTSAAQAAAGRDRVLALVAEAERSLRQAAELSAMLMGWVVPCDRLRTKAREVAMIREKIARGPAPVGHSQFPAG